MSTNQSTTESSNSDLSHAIDTEIKNFKSSYLWLQENMPEAFFREVQSDTIMLIVHSLMEFHLRDCFSQIHLKKMAIVLCLDSADADLRILMHYGMRGIKNYGTYVSKEPLSFLGLKSHLRIATIYFTEAVEQLEEPFPQERKAEICQLIMARNPLISEEAFFQLINEINSPFLWSLPTEQLVLAIDMYFRAKTRDHCQYQVIHTKDWHKKDEPSLQIVLAWRNTPKHDFLHQLSRVIHRHGLVMKRFNATYINPYSKENVLIMALGLHGASGQEASEAADLSDFLKELVTVKYFSGFPLIESTFIDTKLISGNLGNLLRSMVYFIHQILVHIDANLYTVINVEEALCRHPELTIQLCDAFIAKFSPDAHNLEKCHRICEELQLLIANLDTGREVNDVRRRNVLSQGINFIQHTLKTNFFRSNKTALAFRLDPAYLDRVPFKRHEKFPELPFGIFFIKGMHFFGYHIRFRDLARGGLRTVFPEKMEHVLVEQDNVFKECYNLAYTQQKKNKDIPEGGAKGVILLKPNERLASEERILAKELEDVGVTTEAIEQKIKQFHEEQKLEYLYQTQRCFINSLLSLVNCEPDGTLRPKHVVDYWKKPEYLYLGPDENMHPPIIEWIANHSKYYQYKPGGSFITSKPLTGINHKEFGVTSYGVNVYMHEVLSDLDIDPTKTPFTVKMSGGPDGDVAGNQIYNLYKFYPKTAHLIALTDVSGTIYDPQGLDLGEMVKLFKANKPINCYPPEKLSVGGFLLDKMTRRDQSTYIQQTLCWRKLQDKLVQEWLSSSDANRIFHKNVHSTKVDIFVPGGGRPYTLNESNWEEYLDPHGQPTSKAIVEGANLYLTQPARRHLEERSVLIVKDSSANKGGVISSSFEVLFGLTLSDEEFIQNKAVLVAETLDMIRQRAYDEARLILNTHRSTNTYLTDISEQISQRINSFKDELLNYLNQVELSSQMNDPLIRCFLNYCPPFLRKNYPIQLMKQIPDSHKKAIIACHIASRLVYKRGLSWSPSIIEILPLLWEDPEIQGLVKQ